MKRYYSFILLIALLSCAKSPTNTHDEHHNFVQISSNNFTSPDIGCLNLLNNYCDELYSPEAFGNIRLERENPIKILQGDTKNQLSHVFYSYSKAKIKNKNKLPKDFLYFLNQNNYFKKLNSFISKKPIPQMSIEDRFRFELTNYDLGAIWQSSLNNTVLQRMNQKHPGFYKIPPKLIPIEFEIEQKKIRRQIITEISKEIWHEDQNWAKVVTGFTDLKQSFLNTFDSLSIPTDLKNTWKRRLTSMQLVLPGSMPEISDEECSTTTANAYYYDTLNVVTVCAGGFNSEDAIFTLAHEMGHAFDFETTFYNYSKETPLFLKLIKLRDESENGVNKKSCAEWSNFKQNSETLLKGFDKFSYSILETNRCLKVNKETQLMEDKDQVRIATKTTDIMFDYLASNNYFLRLTKEKIPVNAKRSEKNPNYKNPTSYFPWSRKSEPVDDMLYALVLFNFEYFCSNQTNKESNMKDSIDVAYKEMKKIIQYKLKTQGEFSENQEAIWENFSSPSSERFADFIATHAVADYLKRYQDLWEKRSKYLASLSWVCEPPSLSSKFKNESQVEREYEKDTHSQGNLRKMELFSAPIREILHCKKDFSFTECSF